MPKMQRFGYRYVSLLSHSMSLLTQCVPLQLGLYHDTMGDQASAIETLAKALVLEPESAQAVVRLAESYIASQQFDMAHGLLNAFTQGQGWDVAEAWYFLAKACEGQGGRHARVRECLLYALQLEKGRTCRPLPGVIPRWIQ
jgi:tetratricopeptide (TPR) repeat protein